MLSFTVLFSINHVALSLLRRWFYFLPSAFPLLPYSLLLSLLSFATTPLFSFDSSPEGTKMFQFPPFFLLSCMLSLSGTSGSFRHVFIDSFSRVHDARPSLLVGSPASSDSHSCRGEPFMHPCAPRPTLEGGMGVPPPLGTLCSRVLYARVYLYSFSRVHSTGEPA